MSLDSLTTGTAGMSVANFAALGAVLCLVLLLRRRVRRTGHVAQVAQVAHGVHGGAAFEAYGPGAVAGRDPRAAAGAGAPSLEAATAALQEALAAEAARPGAAPSAELLDAAPAPAAIATAPADPEPVSAVAPFGAFAEIPAVVEIAEVAEIVEIAHVAEVAAPASAAAVGYAELSRRYAAQGRDRDAALAQWAADLQSAAPLLERVAALLPRAQEMALAGSHREAVDSARNVVLSLVPRPADLRAQLGPIDHLPAGPVDEPVRLPHHQPTVTYLLDHAAAQMGAAHQLDDTDRAAAGQHAREADLASYEAMLLESALSCGDLAMVTVALRHDLAVLALEHSDAAAADETLAQSVRRTREVLRSLAQPHELAALDVAFVPLTA
ncbi:hypothetical protein E8D34_05760 [Nocardioides sp. GY 10113]|uniref:hypothetical protein n=1 Tax=Nocardioides sp. GY 10113 TaxID=2569761 RepID=UPI0010A7DA1C|nr:hypothetical protein [Nocardioides sp. GY 10113]TIC88427.1 hypothetical protein E8D34_05760 [Nocardioides sp. GY 10113]